MGTSSWQRSTTTTERTVGHAATATSTFGLSRNGLPRRYPASEVTTTVAPASLMRSMSESGLKPPKTTECAAPSRAQASMATTASGIIGR